MGLSPSGLESLGSMCGCSGLAGVNRLPSWARRYTERHGDG